jgi:hypothetical protein
MNLPLQVLLAPVVVAPQLPQLKRLWVVSTMLTAFLSTAEGNPLRLAKQIQSSLKLAS